MNTNKHECRRIAASVFVCSWLSALMAAALGVAAEGDSFRFAILGDRTGGAQAGVYEQAWKEVAGEDPAFVVAVGDTIEGTDADEEIADSDWRKVSEVWKPYRRFALYLAPGNHDIWLGSPVSEQLFRKYSGHPPHYGFDYGDSHFTILDNSRSDELSTGEIAFLEQDLKAHAAARVKLVFMHRPSWIIPVALRNPEFPLHRLAKQYGVQYVVAGHVHQMLRFELEGITYISMASSGGHLRLSTTYEDGWFFGHARVRVTGREVDFQIEELKAPHGQGRITKATDWGMNGLVNKKASQRAAGGSWLPGMAAR
jgi:UDP-2,3-diacylglucosamine pyrophosphatase LpxH